MVNGVQGGTFKTQGVLSFLRVFGAGHEVPFYRKFDFRWLKGRREEGRKRRGWGFGDRS